MKKLRVTRINFCTYYDKRCIMKKKNNGFYYGGASLSEDFGEERERQVEKELGEKTERYRGMSEDELIDELFAQAAAARRRGELSDQKLAAFYDTVKGMLDGSQRRKLDVLMKALMSVNHD